jgi:hypothetical protein
MSKNSGMYLRTSPSNSGHQDCSRYIFLIVHVTFVSLGAKKIKSSIFCSLQLILDMHFIVEIAVCGRFPHRPVQQLVSTIITRAIAAFSARGVDPQRSAITVVYILFLNSSGDTSEFR